MGRWINKRREPFKSNRNLTINQPAGSALSSEWEAQPQGQRTSKQRNFFIYIYKNYTKINHLFMYILKHTRWYIFLNSICKHIGIYINSYLRTCINMVVTQTKFKIKLKLYACPWKSLKMCHKVIIGLIKGQLKQNQRNRWEKNKLAADGGYHEI